METIQVTNLSIPSMSNDIGKISLALAKAQGEIEGATKDQNNPFFKSKYADLASNIDATREAFAKYELAVVQMPFTVQEKHFLVTLITHSSGQWISTGALQIVGNYNLDSQKFLAALTYLRRGQFAAVTRLAQIDDDGNTANDKQVAAPQQQRPAAQAPRQQATTNPQRPQVNPQQRPEGVVNYADHLNIPKEDKERLAKLTNQVTKG